MSHKNRGVAVFAIHFHNMFEPPKSCGKKEKDERMDRIVHFFNLKSNKINI